MFQVKNILLLLRFWRVVVCVFVFCDFGCCCFLFVLCFGFIFNLLHVLKTDENSIYHFFPSSSFVPYFVLQLLKSVSACTVLLQFTSNNVFLRFSFLLTLPITCVPRLYIICVELSQLAPGDVSVSVVDLCWYRILSRCHALTVCHVLVPQAGVEKLGAVLLCGQSCGASRLLSQLNHMLHLPRPLGLGQDPAVTCYVYQGLQGKVGFWYRILQVSQTSSKSYGCAAFEVFCLLS